MHVPDDQSNSHGREGQQQEPPIWVLDMNMDMERLELPQSMRDAGRDEDTEQGEADDDQKSGTMRWVS